MLACLALVLLAVYLPAVQVLLDLADPGLAGWAVIAGMSVLPLFTAPLVRLLVPYKRRAAHDLT